MCVCVTTQTEQGQGISGGKGVVSGQGVSTQTKAEGCMAGGVTAKLKDTAEWIAKVVQWDRVETRDR